MNSHNSKRRITMLKDSQVQPLIFCLSVHKQFKCTCTANWDEPVEPLEEGHAQILMFHAQMMLCVLLLKRREVLWNHFSSSKWTISLSILLPSRFGFRTVELVKRNTLARILLPLPWWHHLLLVSWHHLLWRICNTQPIFPQMHRSSLHWLIWMVTNMTAHQYVFLQYKNTIHTQLTQCSQ